MIAKGRDMTPEQRAKVSIDALLVAADWRVCHMAHANRHAARGGVLREFLLNTGYQRHLDGKAAV